MKPFAKKMKAALCDESAQGATEYILLLVIVVGIVIIFGPKIKTLVQGKLGDIENGFGQVN
jgi:Flp pilus assembly pilin Flp